MKAISQLDFVLPVQKKKDLEKLFKTEIEEKYTSTLEQFESKFYVTRNGITKNGRTWQKFDQYSANLVNAILNREL